jgi:hypothetical protein
MFRVFDQESIGGEPAHGTLDDAVEQTLRGLCIGRADAIKRDIKAAMQDHIAPRVDPDGVFLIKDDKTGETLAFDFVKIHDPVRQIDGRTYIACRDFCVAGAPHKLHDIDFRLRPE